MLAPRIRENIELQKFVAFLEDEMKMDFHDAREGRHKRWTMARLLKSKHGLSSNEYKNSPMMQLLAKQNRVNLRLMKAHFIPKSSIALGKAFASGASGMVLRAEYDSNPVCVKQLYSSLIDPDDYAEFVHEASVLAELTHPQIVRFFGVAVDGERLFIVTELCEDGSLESFIRANQSISLSHKITILLQISRGMDYVHSLGIIHRDLKISNVLVEHGRDSDGFAKIKICDFGVSTCTGKKTYSDLVGTPRHIPPEIITGNVNPDFVTKVDVFSFGMIMWHIFAAKADAESSMSTFESSDELNKAITKRFRPAIDPLWPHDVKKLINDCWHKVPKIRPPFSQVSSRLEHLLEIRGSFATSAARPLSNGNFVMHKSWVGKLKASISSLVGRHSRPSSLSKRADTATITRHGGMSIELSNPASGSLRLFRNPMDDAKV